MLSLTRLAGEVIVIVNNKESSSNMELVVVENMRKRGVQLGFSAPNHIKIFRKELAQNWDYGRKQKESKNFTGQLFDENGKVYNVIDGIVQNVQKL